ncbi:hypothetical protein ACWGBX_01340 [Streptomyces sp. NPDC055037]
MSERTGGRIVLALAVAFAAVALVPTYALDDLDTDPRSGEREFDFAGPRLAVIVSSGSQVGLEPGRGTVLTVVRHLTGTAAKDGHAEWRLEGDTLRLSAKCSGVMINCSGRFVVRVPPGVDTSVDAASDIDVTAKGMRHALRITTRRGDIRLEGTAGALWLSSRSGRIDVLDAASPTVDARNQNAPITLGFAVAPRSVTAASEVGDITVVLPRTDAEYGIDIKARVREIDGIALSESPPYARHISARTRDGAVRVQRLGDR